MQVCGSQKQFEGWFSSSTIWVPPKDQTLGIALDDGYPNKAILMHWLESINLSCIKPSTSAGPAFMSLYKMRGLAPLLKNLLENSSKSRTVYAHIHSEVTALASRKSFRGTAGECLFI